MAIQNRETTLPGIWAENAQTDIPTPPVAGVTYRDTTLNSTAIDKAWPFKTIVDSSDFNQHTFLQDTLIKETEQYGIMRWNNTTTYKEGGFCLGQDGKLYQALRDNQGKEPTSSTDDWKVFTSGGGFPIGSIGYTLRTEVPEGGAWCDGAEYTQAAFPDLYQMLVDGKISSTDYSTFDSSVSTNGSCGLFALNTATTSFKVPLLKDVYVKAGLTPSMFGAESLPNITGDVGGVSWSREMVSTATNIGFNASKSSSIYQDGAKVNPDHVTLRAYVVLYTSAVEASVAQAAEFMTALGGKANIDLKNVSSNIDYVVESYRNGTEWYKIYKSGWVEQGGTLDGNPPSNAGPGGTFTINFLKPFANTNYTVTGACSYTASNQNVNLNFSEFNVDSMKAYSNNGQFWRAEGQGAN